MRWMNRDDMSMVGRFAISKAGHDKGTLYVIVAQEGDFVYMSDGIGKTIERPKKKRLKHVQLMNDTVGEELLFGLQGEKKVYPEEIRYARKQQLQGNKEMHNS